MARGFNLTAEINLRGPSNLRQVVSNLRRQLGSINTNVNVQINQQTSRQITVVNRSFQDFNRTLQQTRNIADATARSINQLGNAARTLSTNLQNIPQTINQVAQGANQAAQANNRAAAATRGATSEFAEFGRQSALAVRRFAAFATVTGVIYKASNAITNATKDFIDFNQQLIKVAQVTDTPVKSLDFLVSNITRLSTGLGVASQDLITVSQTLAQAGLNARDTSIALQALARSALAPSFDNLNNTVEGSIALMRQFGISAGQLEGALGSINAVAAKFAVEAGDIVTAISRTGGVFAAASKGVSQGTDALNEFIAVFTSVRATTRESAETIATGLRTIFTRIQRGETIDALKAYGVALTDLEGKFVGPYEATRRLAEGLSRLDPRDIRFSRIVEELGGFRQIGKVIPLIQQFATAQDALRVAQQGQGSLAKDAATAQLSLANQIAKVREEFTALVRSIGQSQGFQDLVRLGLDLASAFIKVADAVKGALPALTAIFAIKGFQALTQFSRGFAGSLRTGGGQGLSTGGYVHRFASGGVVPGSGRGDKVPALLEPGEVVMSNRAVGKYGRGNLVRMNKYAKGGRLSRVKNKGARDGDSWHIDYEPAADVVGGVTTRAIDYDAYEIDKGKRWEKALGTIATKVADAEYKRSGLTNTGSFYEGFQTNRVKGKYSIGSRPTHEISSGLKNSLIALGAAKEAKKDNTATGSTEQPTPLQIQTLKDYGYNYNTKTGQTKSLTKKNLGGLIQKFVGGGTVEEIAAAKGISIQQAILQQLQALGGGAGIRQILGSSASSPIARKALRKDSIEAGRYLKESTDFINKALAAKGGGDAAEQARISKLSKVAIAGLLPIGYSKDFEWQLGENTTAYANVRGLASRYTEAIAKMQQRTSAAASEFAEEMQYADIFGPGTPLAFDFDETLVSGTDILDKTGKADIPRYSDRPTVEQYLTRGRPTRLLSKLKTLIDADPEFIKKTRILTARPQSTVDLLAKSLQSFGLPYTAQDITGVGGLGANVAKGKAANLGQLEKLIDDNLENVKAAKAAGKQAFLYNEPKRVPALDEIMGQGNIEGAVIEKALAELGANLPSIETLEANRSIDFPGGLGRAAQFFDIDPNIPTEVKRTLDRSSFEKARAEFARYFSENTFAEGGQADPKNTLERYFQDSSFVNLGLTNSKNVNKEQRKSLASDVRNLRRLKTAAPSTLYSSISRVAFDKMAQQIGLNKQPAVPEGTKYFDQEKILANEVAKIKGKSFSLPGFVSTSKNYSIAKSFLDNAPRGEDNWAAMLTIATKKNAQGIDVEQQLSGRNIPLTKQDINPRSGKMETMYVDPPSKEQEVLIQPRSRFRINDVKFAKLGANKNLWANVEQFADGGWIQHFADAGEVRDRSTKNRRRGAYGQRGFVPLNSREYEAFADKAYIDAGPYGGPGWGKVSGVPMPKVLADYAEKINRYVFETGGAGLSIGKKLVKIPDDIEPEALEALKEDLIRQYDGWYSEIEEVLPFGKPITTRRDASVLGKQARIQAAMAAEAGNRAYTSAEDAIAAFKKTGSLAQFDPSIDSHIKRSFPQYISELESSLKSETDADEKASIQRKLKKAQSAWPDYQALLSGAPVANQGRITALSETLNTLLERYGSPVSSGEVDNIIKAMGSKLSKKNLGGFISRFASGGTVPALVSNGEAYVPPKLAKSIGYGKLNRMNQADRNGMGRFAKGGISVFKGPGSGTSDSIPTNLPVGSFIIRAKATKALGLNKGGAVGYAQKLFVGGPPNPGDFEAEVQTILMELEQFKKAIYDGARQAGRTASQAKQAADAAALRKGSEILSRTATPTMGPLPKGQSLEKLEAARLQSRSAAMQALSRQSSQFLANQPKDPTLLNKTAQFFQNIFNWSRQSSQAQRTGAQAQQQASRAQQAGAQAQMNAAQQQQQQAADTDTTETEQTEQRGSRFNLSNLGTALAFIGPSLAQQIGQGIGGTVGAGVSGGATAFSSTLAVGAQFGVIGTFVGALAGGIAAIDGYNSAVEQKKSELAGIDIDKTLEQSVQTRERFAKTGKAEDASQLVSNFQKIQELEQKRSEANIRAERPGYLSSALSTVSFGYLGGDRRSEQEISGARTAEQQVGAQEAQAFISSMITAGKSYDQVTAILQQKGAVMSDLITAIAEADPAYQADVVAIQKSEMAEELKTRRIAEVRQKYVDQARSLTAAQFADVARAKASQKLAQQINIVSASITKTFDNLNQAINASSNNLKQASEELQRKISGGTGFTASLDALNVLQNPRAFGRAEQNVAIGQASQFAGRDRGFVEQLARFSLDAEDIVASGAARAQQAGVSQGVVAQNITAQLTQRLDAIFGQNTIGDELRKQLTENITEALKRGDEIDIQKLLEESGLSGQLQASKQAFDALQNSLKFVQEAMSFAANAANEYGKLQQNLRENQANYQNTIVQSNIALKEALGQRVGVDERIQARRNVAATRAGVAPAQFNATELAGRRDVLQKEVEAVRSALNKTANSFDSTIPNTSAKFLALTKRLAETENALKATEQSLESLPSIIEGNINDIIGEIGRIQQEMSSRQQAAGSFAEQLVGSTPQEMVELNSTFNLLNNTLNGQITTINQSQAAQQAYFQALQNGSTQQEAYAAAQQAFAGQTKSALGLFSQLTQLSGLEGAEINTIRADLLEGFARAQGMGLQNNPMFQKMIELLRKPPEQSAEIQALQGMLRAQQAELATTTQKINEGVLAKQKDILDSANQQFIKALQDVRVKFDVEQLRNVGLGLGTPGQATNAPRLNRGGVVYASDGAYVNYQPRGTDTVPAMLTPGEFVVNARAAKNNLGLLRSINSSAGSGKTFSKGGVVYAAGGITAEELEAMDAATQTLYNRNRLTPARPGLAGVGKPASLINDRLLPNFYPQWMRDIVTRGGGGIRGLLKTLFSNMGSGLSSLGRLDIGSLFKAVTSSVGSQFSMSNLGSSMSGLGRNLLGFGSVAGQNLDTAGLLAGDLVEFGLDDLVRQAGRTGFLQRLSPTLFGGSSSAVSAAGGMSLPLLARFISPAIGGLSGYMADEDKTNRNRYVNTALGILTGTGTTMGDVGAQSFLGGQLGVQQGGIADTQLGNWSQFGLTTAQYMAMFPGLDPATAGLIAAGTMNVQEAVGLYGDRQELADTREKTRRMQDAGRIDSSQIVDQRQKEIVSRAGGYNTYEGRSSTEVAFLTQQARLRNQIEDLKNKQPKNAQDRQALIALEAKEKQLYEEQKTKSATRNEQELFVRTGTFRNSNTFDDAVIQQEIQREQDYLRREDRARVEVAQEETNARQQAADKAKEQQLQQDQAFNAYWKKRQENIERRKAVGLQEWASDKEVAAAEERQKAENEKRISIANEQGRLGRAMSIEVMNPDDPDQQKFSKYRTEDYEASDAVFWGGRLPPNSFSKDYMKAKEQRQELYNQIAQERASIYNPNDPFTPDQLQWEKEKNDRLDRLFQQLDQENQIINTEYKDKKYDQLDYSGRRELWDQYRSGQEKEAKVQKREEIKARNRAAKQQADQMRALAKYANVQVPDKFSNPGAFFNWRKNLQKRIQKDIPFGSRTPEAMNALGIPSDVVNALYQPFSNEQLTSIYSSMLDSGRLSPSASRIVGALRLQKYNLAKKVESDPRLQQIISSASPSEQKAITREFETTFGKSVRQIGVFNQLINRFSNLNPGQQNMARSNLLERATKQGLIDPRASTDFNISRLNALGGGNVASFLYPNQQTQNQAIRVSDRPQRRSRGGVIYASTGMLVPYEPRGTDTVPAMLTPGEFVINRQATQKHRPLLESINRSRGGSVKYLQEGGMSTDVGRYVDGVTVSTPPDTRIDDILMNTKQNNQLGYINRDNIQTNTRAVPANNITTQDKLDTTQDKLDQILECCKNQYPLLNEILKSFQPLLLQSTASLAIISKNDVSKALEQAGLHRFFADRFGNPLDELKERIINPELFRSSGGIIYADKGALVNYQPQGTDTVPAMLTPGEFVVNAKATQGNLGLLHAINSGYMARGGIVYAENGQQVSDRDRFFAQLEAQKPVIKTTDTRTGRTIGRDRDGAIISDSLDPYNKDIGSADPLKAFGVGALKGTGPTAVGIAAGTYATAMAAPLGPAAPLVGLVAGVGAGMLTARSQENYLDALAPQTNAEMKRLVEENPEAATAGSAVPGVGAGLVQQGWRSFVGTMTQRLGSGAASAGIGAGIEYGTTGAVDPTNLGVNFGVGFAQPMGGVASAPLDVPKASKTVSLFHASNTGLEDSILQSFQKEGGKSGIAQGYGQGAGLYTYTSREAAEKHARSIIKGNMLTGADARGKPMIVKFDEALDPSKFDLDYELNAGYVTRWIHDNFDDVQRVLSDQKIPMLRGKGLNPVTGAKGINTQVSTGQPGTLDALVQSSTGGQAPRRWIYDTTDAITREGEVLSRIMKALGKRNPEMVNKFKQGFFETMPAGSAIKYTGSDNLIPSNIDVLAKARGGVVYANNGMLVPYQPKGTDTVPAMLTPGEFVVNRKATQQNLSLLHSINSGHYNQGGRVEYLADGTSLTQKQREELIKQRRKDNLQAYQDEMKRRREAYDAQQQSRRDAFGNKNQQTNRAAAPQAQQRPLVHQAMPLPLPQQVNQAAQAAFNPQFFGNVNQQFTMMGTLLTGLNQELVRFGGILQGFQQPVGRAQPAANNGNGVNNGIAGFVQKFDNFIQQLSKINIPAQINLQMAPTRISVDITGAQFLQSLQPAIQSVIIGNISAAMNTWVENNFDGIAPPDFGNGS